MERPTELKTRRRIEDGRNETGKVGRQRMRPFGRSGRCAQRRKRWNRGVGDDEVRTAERLRFATASVATFCRAGAHVRAIIFLSLGIELLYLKLRLQAVACDSRGRIPMVPDQQTKQTPGDFAEGGSHAKTVASALMCRCTIQFGKPFLRNCVRKRSLRRRCVCSRRHACSSLLA